MTAYGRILCQVTNNFTLLSFLKASELSEERTISLSSRCIIVLQTLKFSSTHWRVALNLEWQCLNRDSTVELVLDSNVYDSDRSDSDMSRTALYDDNKQPVTSNKRV